MAWALCLLVVLLLFKKLLAPSQNTSHFIDLLVYRDAIRDLINHGTLYDYVNYQHLPFTYPPFAALVLFPMAFAGTILLALIWTTITLAGVCYLAYLLAPRVARYFAQRWNPASWRRSPVIPVVFMTLLVIGPVQSDLSNGQVSLFVILATLVDALRLLPEGFRGVATGVAGAIKLVPLLFVPYLWITGQRRAAVTATGTFFACSGVGWLVLPRDSARYWLTELWSFDRVDPNGSWGNISLRSMIPWTHLGEGGQLVIWLALAIVVVAVGMYRAKRADAAGNPLLGAAIVGAVSIVVSPVSWEHHAIWLVMALSSVPFRDPRRWQAWAVICLVVLTATRPYYMISMTVFTGDNLAGLVTAVIASKAQLYLAIAIACLIPFRELHRKRLGDHNRFTEEYVTHASLDHA